MTQFSNDEQGTPGPETGVEEEVLVGGLELLGKTRIFGRTRSDGQPRDDGGEVSEEEGAL